METSYSKIWDLALSRQDLRDDEGHAKTVTDFARELGILLKGDLNVIIPAAILHDTGYYGFSKKMLNDLMAKKFSKEKETEIKDLHMIRGEEFALQVLTQLKYDEEKIKVIAGIVRRHDYSDDFPNLIEEKIVRDADKLWRYSQKGFFLDVKRRGCTPQDWYGKLLKNFEKPNYFYTEQAKAIAKLEIASRKKEF